MLVVLDVESPSPLDQKLVGRQIALDATEHQTLHRQLVALNGIQHTIDSFELVMKKVNKTLPETSRVIDVIDVFAGHYQLMLENGGDMVIKFIDESVFSA